MNCRNFTHYFTIHFTHLYILKVNCRINLGPWAIEFWLQKIIMFSLFDNSLRTTIHFWLQFICTWSGPIFQNLDVFGRGNVHCTASSNNLAWHCSKYSFLNGPEACLCHCFTFRWVFSLSWVLISSVLWSWLESWEM